MHVGVDAHAVERGQEPCACADAVVRRGLQRHQTVGLLVVVLVLAVFRHLVVAVERLHEVVHRDVQLLRQLLGGVGLLQIPLLQQRIEEHLRHQVDAHVRRAAVIERVQAAAAHLVHLLDLLDIVAVEDIAVGVAGLHDGGVQHVVVRAGLVAEALAVEVDLHERLLAEPPPLAHDAVAGLLVGLDGRAVEHACGADGVHLATGPQRGLDAVARGVAAGAVTADGDAHLLVPRLARLHHLQVVAVAARRQDDALGSVDANVVAVVHVAGDDADHTAALVLLQLDELGGPAELRTLLLGILLERYAEVEVLVLLALVGLVRAVAGRPRLVARTLALRADGAFELHDQATVALDDLGEPVDQGAGFVRPHLHQVVVDEAVGIADDVLHGLHLVDLELRVLVERGQLQLRVDGTDVLARSKHGRRAVDAENLRAVLGGGDDGRQAGGAAAHDQHLGVDGLGDIALGDLGSLAQPAGRAGHLAGARVYRLLAGGDGVAVAATGQRTHGGGADGGDARALEEGAAVESVMLHSGPPIPRACSGCGTGCT